MIENITPGKSYTCTFTLNNVPLDRFGRPGGMMSLADLPIEKYGNYTSTGTLVARDTASRLVEVLDDNTNKKYVASFDNLDNIMEDVDETAVQ
jgi:hypothetical protein